MLLHVMRNDGLDGVWEGQSWPTDGRSAPSPFRAASPGDPITYCMLLRLKTTFGWLLTFLTKPCAFDVGVADELNLQGLKIERLSSGGVLLD